MEPYTVVCSPVARLDADNVDTDQIIPARFLKTTTRVGLGAHLFHDWRHDGDGHPRPEFVLNRPETAACRILLAGDNFGCGSSREHAPWALTDFGFRAVIARSFGDIFRQNALRNRLLPVALAAADHRALVQVLTAEPDALVTVDLEHEAVVLPGGRTAGFSIDRFARQCLLAGVDEVGYVLQHEGAIAGYERLADAERPVVLRP